MNVSRLKWPLLVIATGFLLGLFADLMLYQKPPGISIPILVVLFLAALIGLARLEALALVRSNLLLVVPLLFFSAMIAVRAAPLLDFFNLCGVLGLGLLLANRLGTGPLIKLDFGGMALALIDSGLSAILLPVPLLARSGGQAQEGNEDRRSVLRRILVGLAIAAPFLCVFGALFSSADLLFNKLLVDIFKDFDLGDLFGHTLVTGILSWGLMGLLAYALTRTPGARTLFEPPARVAASAEGESPAGSDAGSDAPRAERFKLLGTVESAATLFSIDALFALFVGVQAAALFGGEAFLQRQGLTYSEYARSGFFQLLAVAVITQGLILVLEFITRRETQRHHLVFLLGSGLMIGMTIIILVSAFMRLSLYEQAFGFTRLRVHSHVLMIWIAILLAVFLILLVTRHTRQFAAVTLLAAIGFAATLDLLNPDLFILRRNLARYENGSELDVGYLGTLSADVTPHLIPLLYQYGPEVGAAAGPWLHNHLSELDRRQAQGGWYSYHAAYDSAFRAVDANRKLIESFPFPDPYTDELYIIAGDAAISP